MSWTRVRSTARRADLICHAGNLAGLDPAPGHPDREAPRIMVTPVQTGDREKPVVGGISFVFDVALFWILFLEHRRKGPPVEVGSPVIDKAFEISAIGSLFTLSNQPDQASGLSLSATSNLSLLS